MTALFSLVSPAQAQTQTQRPNIVVIWGDDIGFWNISAYSRGMMGYQTPNIDRIANEGALFTDVYAQQSCTAGRAAFILGQSPFRTGLLTIGVPGSPQGMPFFLWFNTTRMHVWTHLKKESEGKTGIGLYPDGMVEHD